MVSAKAKKNKSRVSVKAETYKRKKKKMPRIETTNQVPATQEAKELQVHASISLLELRVGKVEVLANDLHIRLQNVSVAVPEEVAPDKQPVGSKCSMADNIDSYSYRLNSVIDYLERTIQGLEI